LVNQIGLETLPLWLQTNTGDNMPSPQVIDLNPSPRTELTPLEKTLSGFSKRNRENQIEQQDTDALKEIYGQYQQDGHNIENALINIQTRPGMSPTARVNAAKQLTDFQKYNQELQKKTQKQIVDSEKEMEAEAALRKAGATDKQVALYKASPVGGQTKIVEDVIEQTNRAKTPVGTVGEDVEDFDKGLLAGERVKRQDARFSLQTPLLTKNSDQLIASENERMSLDLLQELDNTGKVGQGVQNLNINPKTGDLIIPKAATPEEQLFVKTVNDFTVKAKDSFGARVTNFELDRFMQRLPTLANSQEGRRMIIRQMKIINEINSLEKRAIQGVFDKYGVRNIDYIDAENIARNQIKDQKESLRKEYLEIEQLAKKEDENLILNIKSKVKPGYVALRTPEGTIKQFPEKNVQSMLDGGKGYKKL